MTEERVIDKKNGIDRRVKYAYDEVGNILKRTILGTGGECLESSIRYDLKDRATHKANSAGAVIRYLYDHNDRLVRATAAQERHIPTTATATVSVSPML